MSEMINKLSQEVNNAVTESMSDVQDYVNITLQVMDPIPSPKLETSFLVSKPVKTWIENFGE
jgi:hypothetical protein